MLIMNCFKIITVFIHIILILVFPGMSTAQTTDTFTLPPPTPHSCCRFESDICGFTFANFYWSAQYSAPYSVPYQSGNYIWTTSEFGELTSSTQYNVTSTTFFTFSYYNHDCPFKFYFRQIETGTTKYISSISTSPELTWQLWNTTCSTCCDQFPCNGQILLAPACSSNYLLAIDNIGRDSSCEEVIPCCTFGDVGMCGFQSTTGSGYSWVSSIQKQPFNPPPSGSSYVFFESVNYTGSAAMDVILESPPLKLTSQSSIISSIFVKDSGSPTTNNYLLVVFKDSVTGGSTQLDYVIDTGASIYNYNFECESYHGNCCPSGACNGTIQFIAHLDAFGGKVMFAIDKFTISDGCSL